MCMLSSSLRQLGFMSVLSAGVTFVDLDEVVVPTSLADGFKLSLVRQPDEPDTSDLKTVVETSSVHLLDEQELRALDEYDAIFEKYSMFCNGRWLGAQVLQDSQDLMYLQHIAYMKKPDVIIETGTYKGGLTYFFASVLDWIDAEGSSESIRKTSKIISIDRHHPHSVFNAKWFCPVCDDCIRPYITDVWHRKVQFVQGMADSSDVYVTVAAELNKLGYLQLTHRTTGDIVYPPGSVDIVAALTAASVNEKALVNVDVTMDPSKTVVVNLDASHAYEGVMRELFYYALLVSLNSYLIVQDVKLDKIWGTVGPSAAVSYFLSLLPQGEFVVEPELKFHAYSQHMYLRRANITVRHTYFMEIDQSLDELIQAGLSQTQ